MTARRVSKADRAKAQRTKQRRAQATRIKIGTGRQVGRPVWMGHTVPINVLFEMVCAAHLGSLVQGDFKEHGGMMLVGPPGMMKSTVLEILESNYPDVLALSDINAQALNKLKSRITDRSIRTLVLPEYAKIYERNVDTANNVEGTLRAMVSEGFKSASFDNPLIARQLARATLLAAMTPEFREKHSQRWQDSGFARRFIWPLLSLQQPEILDDAVERWELLDFRVSGVPPIPSPAVIPNLTTPAERKAIRMMVRYQPHTHTSQFQFMIRCLAVLKWWYRARRRDPGAAFHTVSVFARSLGKQGAELVI